MSGVLARDLDHILACTEQLWQELRKARIFITGGTGFFGCWLLESFAWANERLGLDASACVLTRNPEAFKRKARHIAFFPGIEFQRGDVRSFDFPKGTFSHVIHAAASPDPALRGDDPLLVWDTITQGTRRTLEFARSCGASKFLLTSSGAVYGRQADHIPRVDEDYRGAPDCTETGSLYAEGKRASELLCAVFAEKYGFEAKIARCFAIVGPYLPVDGHFAIGNFIQDGIRGGPICVKGDGTPRRSYLYAADLMIWLWTILFQGVSCRPYNVGSDEQIRIADLARLVAGVFGPSMEVEVAKESVAGLSSDIYLPSTSRARLELGLRQTVDLVEAIRNTVHWSLAKS